MKVVIALTAALLALPVGAVGSVATADDGSKQQSTAIPADDSDVIAMVGDQPVSFSEINIALNSSAIVGVSIPALGTPERDTARITLLDKFVSANLIYLDAKRLGVDKDPDYVRATTRFSNAMLAGLYRKRIQTGEIAVSDDEIQTYAKDKLAQDTELTDDVKLQIESSLRRDKLHERLAEADRTLRDGIAVKIHDENLDVVADAIRAADTPLAEVDGDVITWGLVGDRIVAAGKGATMADPLASESQARRDALEHEIDVLIMARKAREAGLEQDPLYGKRVTEYRKTLLTNLHRDRLFKQWEPGDAALKAYYDANRSRFLVPEARKIQMVVVATKDQADEIKHKLDAGEISMFEAARDYSTAADARKNLGEVGWVSRGDLFGDLDKVVFELAPGAIGGPVKSPAGWHLVSVQEMNDAKFTDFGDAATHRLTRRKFLQEKLDAYTTELRKERFKVEVYEDRLTRLAQQEADMVAELTQKSREPGSVTEKRIEEMQKLMHPPAQ